MPLPVSRPTPQQVREWERAPVRQESLPLTPEQARIELGWDMTARAGQTREGRS